MRKNTSLALLFLVVGCSATHGAEPFQDAGIQEDAWVGSDAGPEADAELQPDSPAVTTFESCLASSGSLVERARINNNDTTAHGNVTALAVSNAGLLAVTSADGVAKFWTLEGFVGSVSAGAITYGPEIAAPPATDLAFDGAELMLADSRGLVTGWTSDGEMRVIGGTQPFISIVAVATDPARHRLAHAEDVSGGHVMVRGTGEDPTVVGPLDTHIEHVTDLAFLADGRLVIGGSSLAGAMVLEVRASADPTVLLHRFDSLVESASESGHVVAPVEIAVAAGRIVLTAESVDLVFTDELAFISRVDVSPSALSRTIATTQDGQFAFHAQVHSGARVIEAFQTSDAALGTQFAPDGLSAETLVSLRFDPGHELLFAAYENGTVVAAACAIAE